jgi:hypothetical protein
MPSVVVDLECSYRMTGSGKERRFRLSEGGERMDA